MLARVPLEAEVHTRLEAVDNAREELKQVKDNVAKESRAIQARRLQSELRHAAVNSPPYNPISHLAFREAQGLRSDGFGLLLAKNLVDELIYSEQGNDVLLVKYVNPPSSQVA